MLTRTESDWFFVSQLFLSQLKALRGMTYGKLSVEMITIVSSSLSQQFKKKKRKNIHARETSSFKKKDNNRCLGPSGLTSGCLTVTGTGVCVTQTDSGLLIERHTAVNVWKSHLRNAYEVITSVGEKVYASYRTRENVGVTVWATKKSTNKGSPLSAQHPNVTMFSLLPAFLPKTLMCEWLTALSFKWWDGLSANVSAPQDFHFCLVTLHPSPLFCEPSRQLVDPSRLADYIRPCSPYGVILQ